MKQRKEINTKSQTDEKTESEKYRKVKRKPGR
jgi:hypothetical protein